MLVFWSIRENPKFPFDIYWTLVSYIFDGIWLNMIRASQYLSFSYLFAVEQFCSQVALFSILFELIHHSLEYNIFLWMLFQQNPTLTLKLKIIDFVKKWSLYCLSLSYFSQITNRDSLLIATLRHLILARPSLSLVSMSVCNIDLTLGCAMLCNNEKLKIANPSLVTLLF